MADNVKGHSTPFGFQWGPALVERRMEQGGRICLGIRTDTGREIHVYVSRTGRSLRVFENGQELTTPPAAPQAPAEPTATPHGLIGATHVVNLHRSDRCAGCNAADEFWCSCPDGYEPPADLAGPGAREDTAPPNAEMVTLDDLVGPECGKTGRTSDAGCDGTCSACTPDDYGDDVRPSGPVVPLCADCGEEPATDPRLTVNGQRVCGECWTEAESNGFDNEEASSDL